MLDLGFFFCACLTFRLRSSRWHAPSKRRVVSELHTALQPRRPTDKQKFGETIQQTSFQNMNTRQSAVGFADRCQSVTAAEHSHHEHGGKEQLRSKPEWIFKLTTNRNLINNTRRLKAWNFFVRSNKGASVRIPLLASMSVCVYSVCR
jgi:hypothetical protein